MTDKITLAENQLIVLEGLSGSGKTTIGKLLSKEMKAIFYKTPPPPFDNARELIDRSTDPVTRFFFYLAAVIHASDEITGILENNSVVCDRYILTTTCYHRALGLNVEAPNVSLLEPKNTFLITCDDSKRLARLLKRGLSYNDQQEQLLSIENRFLAEYRKHNVTEVDNTYDNPHMAVQTILNLI